MMIILMFVFCLTHCIFHFVLISILEEKIKLAQKSYFIFLVNSFHYLIFFLGFIKRIYVYSVIIADLRALLCVDVEP